MAKLSGIHRWVGRLYINGKHKFPLSALLKTKHRNQTIKRLFLHQKMPRPSMKSQTIDTPTASPMARIALIRFTVLHAFAIAGVLTIGLILTAISAEAQLSVTDAVGGIPTVSGATLETFDEPAPSILTLSGNASLVTGALSGAFDAYPPDFSGSTAAFFGEQPNNGPDATQYVEVHTGGAATMRFTRPETYFGILWGSPDAANTLAFYDINNNVIGKVLGQDFLDLHPIPTPTRHFTSTLLLQFPSRESMRLTIIIVSSLKILLTQVRFPNLPHGQDWRQRWAELA